MPETCAPCRSKIWTARSYVGASARTFLRGASLSRWLHEQVEGLERAVGDEDPVGVDGVERPELLPEFGVTGVEADRRVLEEAASAESSEPVSSAISADGIASSGGMPREKWTFADVASDTAVTEAPCRGRREEGGEGGGGRQAGAGGPYAGGPYAGGPYAGGPYAGGPYAGGPGSRPGAAGAVGPGPRMPVGQRQRAAVSIPPSPSRGGQPAVEPVVRRASRAKSGPMSATESAPSWSSVSSISLRRRSRTDSTPCCPASPRPQR